MEKKPFHQISGEQIINQNPLAQVISKNLHLPFFQQAAALILATYEIRAKFIALGNGGEWIWVNHRPLVWREKKFTDVSFGDNVIYLDGNLNRRGGGSNQYPSVGHEGAYCELEFISYGLPEQHAHTHTGWKMEILSIKKI